MVQPLRNQSVNIFFCLAVLAAGFAFLYPTPFKYNGTWASSSVTAAKEDRESVPQGDNSLLQYTSGGHILGFRQGEMFLAAMDHALKVEFVDGNPVVPKEEGALDKGQKSEAQRHKGTEAGKQLTQKGSEDGKAKPLGSIRYANLWEGVDLVYEREQGGVAKSTYYVAPTSSRGTKGGVNQIRLRYNVSVQIDKSGSLLLAFETGQLKESAPVAWQEINGNRVYVDVRFSQLGEKEIGFQAGQYDASYPLVIDPTLSWNTFLGESTDDDFAYGVAVDSSGNVYVAGYSFVTWGSPVRAYTGNEDAFVAKLSNAGALTWSTFLGGSGADIGYAIAVDSSGNVYATGYSSATWGSPVTAYTSGKDGFAAKLSSAGALTWHTFLGGSGTDDEGYNIAVDSSGNVYAGGFSNATWGSPVRAYTAGYDAFAAKLSSAGALTWNTFLGGTGAETRGAIAVDSSGNVYVAGYTDATWGSPVRAYTSGADSYAVKLSSAGALTWNTFLGGTGADAAESIAVDSSGNVYVSGSSGATWGSPVTAYTSGVDGYAAKLSSAGALTWNTFIGGSGNDTAYGIAVDSIGNVYVSGKSGATWGSPGRAYTSGTDGIAAKLSSAGALTWNTFLGGSGTDTIRGIAVDSSDNVYVSGYTDATWGSPVTAYTGNVEAFAAKISSSTTVDFSSATYNGTEKEGSLTITVELSAASASSVTVDYASSDGTATAGTDYTAVSGTLTFSAGTTSQTFTVTPNNDSLDEGSETVTLTLSNASNATLGSTNTPAVLTIWDAEFPIPTMSEWGMIFLATLSGLWMFYSLKREQ